MSPRVVDIQLPILVALHLYLPFTKFSLRWTFPIPLTKLTPIAKQRMIFVAKGVCRAWDGPIRVWGWGTSYGRKASALRGRDKRRTSFTHNERSTSLPLAELTTAGDTFVDGY